MELAKAKQRAMVSYRNQKRYLARIEKKLLETPTHDLALEVAERKGILKGILLCWDAIEERMNDNLLPIFQEEHR